MRPDFSVKIDLALVVAYRDLLSGEREGSGLRLLSGRRLVLLPGYPYLPLYRSDGCRVVPKGCSTVAA
jgi:hypothetical protein